MDNDERNPTFEKMTQSLPDKISYVTAEHVSIKAARTALSRVEQALTDKKYVRALEQTRILLQRVEERQNEHEKAYYDLMRQYTELMKRYAIQSPPDQQPLQTIPYAVGQPTATIHNKSELTKRTMSSTATIQKKNVPPSGKK